MINISLDNVGYSWSLVQSCLFILMSSSLAEKKYIVINKQQKHEVKLVKIIQILYLFIKQLQISFL